MNQQTLIDVEENAVLPRLPDPNWHQRRIASAIARKASKKAQMEGIESQDIFKATIDAKLRLAGVDNRPELQLEKWLTNFRRCGVEKFVMMCEACEHVKECSYKCSLKWCPRCNWLVSFRRKELLDVVTRGMFGVKHVVLTQKNFPHLTHEKILSSRKNLFHLRRQKILGTVTGGCASLEFTNEKKGWHMHWHLLVQSQFIDASELSIAWGKLVDQEFAIVKVMSVDEKSYLQELCKYVVSGAEMARWTPEHILEFVIALKRTRFFSTFGKFREVAKFARSIIACDKPEAEACKCGCNSFVFAPDASSARRINEKFHQK